MASASERIISGGNPEVYGYFQSRDPNVDRKILEVKSSLRGQYDEHNLFVEDTIEPKTIWGRGTLFLTRRLEPLVRKLLVSQP